MNSLKSILMSCVFFLPLSAQAESFDSASLRSACGFGSQAEMLACLSTKAKESQSHLASAERTARSSLKNWDEDKGYVDKAISALAAADGAFSRYRSLQCGYIDSTAGGAAGNSHEIMRLACVAELNEGRAQQLLESTTVLHAK